MTVFQVRREEREQKASCVIYYKMESAIKGGGMALDSEADGKKGSLTSRKDTESLL